MSEKIVRFGPDDGLLGVLSEPASAHPDAPAVLLLNAGLLHRAGPYCWYTALARRLAARGFLTLRFDLSGVGDSAARKEKLSDFDRAQLDISDAMNHLSRTRKARQFVLMGLCSGALFAHQAAVKDARVAGVVHLDGFGYPTPGYYARHYAPRLLRPSAWLGVFRRLTRHVTGAPTAPAYDGYFVEFPPRDQARAELAELLRRGTALLFAYTGGLADLYFNHRCQFREMFGDLDPAGDALQVDYDARADHLYSSLDRRAALFERVEAWLGRFLRGG